MSARLQKQVDKLDGQTELYLVLLLLGIALLMILVLVACNCALTCCRCRGNRRRDRRKKSVEEYDENYYRQIHGLLQRQQTIEREWEERRRIHEEYRVLSPAEASESLSRLASRNPSPARSKRSFRIQQNSSKNGLKGELDNYKVNHSVKIQAGTDTFPLLKRQSWAAILDGKEIELNEEDIIGGSMVIVRRYEPIKMVGSRSPIIKKDTNRHQKSTKITGSGSKRRSQHPSIETIV